MDKFFLLVIFHIVFVAPLFLFVGFQRAATPEIIYQLLFGLGILIGLYHGYKAIMRIFVTPSPNLWINLIHVLVVAPMLIYLGWLGKKSERWAYEILLLLGFGVLGYQLYHLVVITQTFVKTPEI